MIRKDLLDMIAGGTAHIRAFIADIDAEKTAPGSFEDWNDIDVAGHIVGWMDYSVDKLRCLKLGTAQSGEYAGISSLEEINRILYDKSRNGFEGRGARAAWS